MKIICAGFPKTGTKSMASALRQLGYNVNDFPEHLQEGGLFAWSRVSWELDYTFPSSLKGCFLPRVEFTVNWILPYPLFSRSLHLPSLPGRENSQGGVAANLEQRRRSDRPTHLPSLANSPSTLPWCQGGVICCAAICCLWSDDQWPLTIPLANIEQFSYSFYCFYCCWKTFFCTIRWSWWKGKVPTSGLTLTWGCSSFITKTGYLSNFATGSLKFPFFSKWPFLLI